VLIAYREDNMVLDYLTFDVKSAMIQHMLDNLDVEVCGLISLSNGEYTYEPQENVHPQKDEPGLDVFKFAPKVSKRIVSDKNVVAYVHSHPNGPMFASLPDMETQVKVKKTSVIVARDTGNGIVEVFAHGDEMLDYPLYDRVFRSGCTDCYEFIRAWKWQVEQTYLDPFPRNDDWYHMGKKFNENGVYMGVDFEQLKLNPDMYDKNFESQGFIEYEPDFSNPNSVEYPQVGDLLFMQLDAPVINHCAVYIGNNQIAHHRFGKKSGTNAIGYLLEQGYIRKWARGTKK
jgi:proteasome lid subunit RPN8/RPN11